MFFLAIIAINMGFKSCKALPYEVIAYAWVLRDFLEIVCQKFREGVVQPPRGGKGGGSDACDAIEIRRARAAQAAV